MPRPDQGVSALQKELRPGTFYVFQEKRADRALGLYNLLTAKGKDVLVVARMHPDRLQEDLKIPSSRVYWLSNTAGPRNINPQNIGILTDLLVRTVEKGDEAVIFEGVEYLMLQNDFQKILKLFNYLYESVAINRGILIMTLDPAAFNVKELALLTKDAEIIDQGDSVLV